MKRLQEIGKGQALPNTRGFPVRRRRGAPDPLLAVRYEATVQVAAINESLYPTLE